jgi:hypothetical protein
MHHIKLFEIKTIFIMIILIFISCGTDKETENNVNDEKCFKVTCNENQYCEEGICLCQDPDEKINEFGDCIRDTIAPIIKEVKNIEVNSFSYTNNPTPEYTFNSNEFGSLMLSGDCKIENKPNVNFGNNTIKFDEMYSGLYDNCEIWVTDTYGNESNHLKIANFSVFNVMGTQTIKGRTDGKGVDYVIIGDGFKKDEIELFHQKAEEFSEYILNYDPVLSMQKNSWNIHIVDLVSKESGADNSNMPNTPTLVNTGLDSYFNCYDIERLLCINQSKVNYIVNEYFPQFDKVLIIVNSSTYGGAGGDYATTSIHPEGKKVAIHELGHSFAGLADEYEYGETNPPTNEPQEANITINNDPNTVKWNKWLDEPNIDIFEGGGYVDHGVYRPTLDSLMRTLGQPLYQVNLEAWTLSLYQMLGTYYSKKPESDNPILWGTTDYDFSIELSIGIDLQKVEWFVDGIKQEDIPEDTLSFRYGKERVGKYQVKAVISDKSGVIRNDINNTSTGEAVWNVTSE